MNLLMVPRLAFKALSQNKLRTGLTMLGIGIAGLAGYGWRRRKQSLPA